MWRFVLAATIACVAPYAHAQSSDAPAPPGERSIAGKVVVIEGDVRIYDDARNERRPKLGDAVYEGDNVFTGSDGEVHFSMTDGAYIGVRPNTKMRLATYKAEGGADDQSVITLLEGSFRTVTGWIGKLGAKHYQIDTPTVTIGVRGTDHEPRVVPEGNAEGEAGTYDRVYAGETVMGGPQGTVSVQANKAGFAALRGTARPRVLDRIPVFFRGTRNEARFRGLHARTQQRLERLRQQRVREIQQRRAHAAAPRGERAQAHASAVGHRPTEMQRASPERREQASHARTAQRIRMQQNHLGERRELRANEHRAADGRGAKREREFRRRRAE